MKKILSLMLIIVTAFCLTSCGSGNKKYGVYYELNGEVIDISDIKKYGTTVYNSWLMTDYSVVTFDEKIEDLKEKGLPYFVAKVEWAGAYKNVLLTDIDKNEENAAHYNHLSTSESKFSTEPPYQVVELLFSEIPIKIIEILEGDSSLAEKDQVITLELNDIFLQEKEDGLHFHMPGDLRNVILREGYEYIMLIQYYPDTGCYVSTLHMYACELSTPEDQIEFKCNFNVDEYTSTKERYESEHHSIEEKMRKVYYEILDRYNIKVD